MTGKVDMKVVMLGQMACGKTSLVERFMHNHFSINYQTTIGAAFGARIMDVAGKKVCIGLWDTAGSERYEAMGRIYYRDAMAAVVCYDITQPDTLARAKFWVTELNKNEENCKLYLCGTKLDLVEKDKEARRVDFHDVTEYGKEVGAKVIETSSKTGENVEELFAQIVQDFAESNAAIMASLKDSFPLTEDDKPRRKCC
ncbi:hypothetical protein Pcinc_021552 [Petrolisthes cinctipes]|uniref:Ras-related protein Rab-24 n=1 Tax=Petrolisthes cinctipes TaxID=88211 RepID=A0AAE1FFF5_PETCI|nr:hypothetical protein Pcinc_021552 [Petrolisthes cinctipes]